MPNLTIRRICVLVREFFEEHKKTDFFYDIVNVDLIDGEWEVECLVSNEPSNDGNEYLIRMLDSTGEITHISMQNRPESVDDDDDDDDKGEEEDEEEEEVKVGGSADIRGPAGDDIRPDDPGPGGWH